MKNPAPKITYPINRFYLRILVLLGALLAVIVPSTTTQSQNEPVTISINLTALQYENLVYSGLVEEFEEAHPGIRIHVKRNEGAQPFIQTGGEAEQLASTADIVFIDSNTFNPEVTLAGIFLDLNPLVSVDDSLNVDDFHPTVWQSFQWDGSIWAVPLNFQLSFLSYDPVAFDEAGLAYPEVNWTVNELIEAARTLTTRDDQGNVITDGFQLPISYGSYPLLRSLLGENLFDEANRPATPRLNTPAASQLVQAWSQFISEGISGTPTMPFSEEAPITMTGNYDFYDADREMVLLPGGRAGMRVNSLAISAGTLYPEEAYEFVKFLSHHPDEFGLGLWGRLPARTSVEAGGSWDYIDPEYRDLVTESIPYAIPLGETRNFDYFARAVYRVDQGMSPEEALQEVENMAIQSQQTLLSQRDGLSLVVESPPPAPEELPSGEIALRFGFHGYTSAQTLPNQSLWDSVIEDFVAHDPQIGRMDMVLVINPQDFTEHFDCFFTPRGVGLMQPSELLNLDPLMAADPDFDANDFVPGALEQLRFENQLWGYPLVVQLEVLSYDVDAFSRAGVPLLSNTWTVNDFTDAIYTIKSDDVDTPVFSTTRFVSTDYLELIASFGGLPIDYRTDPPTPQFTDPVNVEAIRNVLDLARDGYIQYVTRLERGERPGTTYYDAPIRPTSFGFIGSGYEGDRKQVLYPAGSTYAPIGMGVAAMYISANTLYPEACYRWISTIAAHPGLIVNGMPARVSDLNSEELLAAQGSDKVALYNVFYEQLQSPDTIIFPSPWTGSASFSGGWLEYWLDGVFAAYVYDDADLEQSLEDAQIVAEAYIGCIDNLPARSRSDDYIARYELYTQCAADIDPSIPAP